MVSKNVISGLSWFLIITGLGLAGFGLYSLGFNNNPVYSIPLLVVGLVFFAIGIVLYIKAERKAKQQKEQQMNSRGVRRTQIIPTQVLVSPDEREPFVSRSGEFNENIEQSEITREEKILRAKRIYSLKNEETCMISKLPIARNDKVLQCPSCQSFFIEDYLIEWLQVNHICPVCKIQLEV